MHCVVWADSFLLRLRLATVVGVVFAKVDLDPVDHAGEHARLPLSSSFTYVPSLDFFDLARVPGLVEERLPWAVEAQ